MGVTAKDLNDRLTGTDEDGNKVPIIVVGGGLPSTIKDVSITEFNFAKNGSSTDLRVDGSTTPVVFTIPAPSSGDHLYISQLRFSMTGNGIKWGQFGPLAAPVGGLTTGIALEITSNGSTVTWDISPFKITEDLSYFDNTGTIQIREQAGRDFFISQFNCPQPFRLKSGTADKVKITIKDDLTGATLKLFNFLSFGSRA